MRLSRIDSTSSKGIEMKNNSLFLLEIPVLLGQNSDSRLQILTAPDLCPLIEFPSAEGEMR